MHTRWMSFIRSLVIIGLLAALAFSAVGVTPAYAAGVVSTCDEASLLTALSGGGLVTFSCSGTINLTSTITIASDTTLDGAGQSVTISGNNTVRVFWVNSGVTFNLNAITVANGKPLSGYGGGIYNDGGTVNITNSTLSGNSAYSGGGIANILGGTVVVTNSTLSGNSSLGGDGGGIFSESGTLNVTSSALLGNFANGGGAFGGGNGGGISSFSGVVNVTNSTLSGNSSVSYGGGIINYGYGTMTVTNSTLSWNSAAYGGGIYSANTTLRNTIVANSISGGNCYVAPIDGGNNIDDGETCGFGAANGSMSSTNPQFVDAAGGNLRLDFGSPAIDTGTNTGCPANDLDGLPRPNDGDASGTATCDMGAYEAGTMTCSVDVGTYPFPNQSNVSIQVTTPGTLACLYVDEMELDHRQATGTSGSSGLKTGRYWLIRGLQNNRTTDATGFLVNLTLSHNGFSAPKACRYTGGAGYGWDCAVTGFDSATVWRNGVDAFSDWAVGNNVGPTAIGLSALRAESTDRTSLLPIGPGALLLILAGGVLVINRKQRRSQA